ncbi:ribonuclease E/G [Acidisphaera sp. S103]|uniref:ribonuclease E/G n=1 Tax=Acidisphaera sp. S103 TaxID=1747223 RepID=UPI00131C7FC2|nr:ribonuclease E/G [Acidisphaera sp. S103]
MTISIRVATSPGEARIAVVDDNRLVDFFLWRFGTPDGVGDVHRGRIMAHVPAMAGAFVALADAEGFLPDSEGAKGLTAGTILTVRITRAAQGHKGPRLTARGCDPAAGGPVGLIHRGPDPVARLAGRYPDAAVLVDDAGVAAGLRLGARVSVTPSVWEEDVAEAIDALSEPVVVLPGGASLSIWPTPALVAIDVDAGGALTGAGGARSRHEALNRAVVPALAEQIRLRNLSGGIVVDLAGLSPRKRAGLGPDFVAALAGDPLRPRFLGFTALGLAEIVRSRVHPPLHELLAGPLAAGLMALRAVMAAFGRDPRGMPAVRAHPAVVSALQGDTAALADLARRTGRGVTLRSDPSLPATAWVLEKDHG